MIIKEVTTRSCKTVEKYPLVSHRVNKRKVLIGSAFVVYWYVLHWDDEREEFGQFIGLFIFLMVFQCKSSDFFYILEVTIFVSQIAIIVSFISDKISFNDHLDTQGVSIFFSNGVSIRGIFSNIVSTFHGSIIFFHSSS